MKTSYSSQSKIKIKLREVVYIKRRGRRMIRSFGSISVIQLRIFLPFLENIRLLRNTNPSMVFKVELRSMRSSGENSLKKERYLNKWNEAKSRLLWKRNSRHNWFPHSRGRCTDWVVVCRRSRVLFISCLIIRTAPESFRFSHEAAAVPTHCWLFFLFLFLFFKAQLQHKRNRNAKYLKKKRTWECFYYFPVRRNGRRRFYALCRPPVKSLTIPPHFFILKLDIDQQYLVHWYS